MLPIQPHINFSLICQMSMAYQVGLDVVVLDGFILVWKLIRQTLYSPLYIFFYSSKYKVFITTWSWFKFCVCLCCAVAIPGIT